MLRRRGRGGGVKGKNFFGWGGVGYDEGVKGRLGFRFSYVF